MRAFLSYAFRPFFLAMALFAVVAMLVWWRALHGGGPDWLPSNVTYWHAHELLIGFALAAVAGFVLTAVATWTGRPAVSGWPLGLLLFTWLAGRVAMLCSGLLPATWVLATDMLFPLLLVVMVAREVFAAGNRRNYPIVLITLLLGGFNLLFHAGVTGLLPLAVDAERVSLYLMIHLLLLLVTVIAGRIVPNFTANWLRAHGAPRLPRSSPALDRGAVLATIATGLFAAFLPASPLTGVLAIVTGLLHAVRLSRWCGWSVRGEPLLFVLHVAYLWLPLGYWLTAAAVFGWSIDPTAAVHALTVGALSTMILAVTTRVALAHTGRRLHAAPLTVLSYGLLTCAALLRVLSPFGEHYLAWLDGSVALWVATFGLFCWTYAPIVLRPRVDA